MITWNMSFLQLQAIYPGNIPLQKEYLQRQLDSLFDTLRDLNVQLNTLRDLNVQLNINLGIQLSNLPPHSHQTNQPHHTPTPTETHQPSTQTPTHIHQNGDTGNQQNAMQKLGIRISMRFFELPFQTRQSTIQIKKKQQGLLVLHN